MDKKEVLKHFRIEQGELSLEPYGSGHINRTFAVSIGGRRRYILQGINNTIFRDVDALMENIIGVTSYLREKITARGGNPERETLTVIMTTDDKAYYCDNEGNVWRVYLFIENAESFDMVRSKEDFYRSAAAFGNFQALLADYPADTLHETIPDFHNTPKRYQDFEKAVENDCCHRAETVKKEIEFIRARKEELSILSAMLERGELPLRVTHNDTKLNNIMLDRDTHEAICIIDLDTVMPGLSVHDFGDSVRFGANTALEDEPDVGKVSLSLELFEVYVKGFLEGCGERLTANEIKMLPMGAKMMTIECGMRFLADYLQGDVYFKINREHHNLERCRTQLALVADMEKKWERMCALCKNSEL